MAQLIPGTIFKTPGFSTRDLPYGFGVSAEEIIQKNYKDNAKLGFVRLMVRPTSQRLIQWHDVMCLIKLNHNSAMHAKISVPLAYLVRLSNRLFPSFNPTKRA